MNILKTTIKTSIGKASSLLFDLGRNLLFIKTLSVETFGLLSLGNNLVQSNKYLDFGFANKFLIDSYDGRFTSFEAKQVFYAIIIFEFFLLSLCGLGFLLFISSFDKSIMVDGAQLLVSTFLPIMVILAFFSARLYKLSLIWRRHKKNFVEVSIIEVTLSAFLLIGSLLVLILDFLTFANSYFFLQVILFLAFAASTFKIFYGTKININWLFVNLKESLLLTCSTFIYGLSFYFDRFILVTYFGLTEIGNYAFLLFILNFGSALITYGLQPIRAHIASLIADADKNTRNNVLINICKKSGLYIFIIGMAFINLVVPSIKYWMHVFLAKYELAIIDLHYVFSIILTFPLLYLLGYLLVAKPFNKTGIYAVSQLAGIVCMAISFFVMNSDDSIYSALLLGIYFGNVVKILLYISVMASQQKWCLKNIYQLFLCFPFLFLPLVNYA